MGKWGFVAKQQGRSQRMENYRSLTEDRPEFLDITWGVVVQDEETDEGVLGKLT